MSLYAGQAILNPVNSITYKTAQQITIIASAG
jgi:hypothetical protein